MGYGGPTGWMGGLMSGLIQGQNQSQQRREESWRENSEYDRRTLDARQYQEKSEAEARARADADRGKVLDPDVSRALRYQQPGLGDLTESEASELSNLQTEQPGYNAAAAEEKPEFVGPRTAESRAKAAEAPKRQQRISFLEKEKARRQSAPLTRGAAEDAKKFGLGYPRSASSVMSLAERKEFETHKGKVGTERDTNKELHKNARLKLRLGQDWAVHEENLDYKYKALKDQLKRLLISNSSDERVAAASAMVQHYDRIDRQLADLSMSDAALAETDATMEEINRRRINRRDVLKQKEQALQQLEKLMGGPGPQPNSVKSETETSPSGTEMPPRRRGSPFAPRQPEQPKGPASTMPEKQGAVSDDQKALRWAQANPQDPRSRAIMQHLQAKGLT